MPDDEPLAPLPRARGHLTFIGIGIVLVIVGVAQIQVAQLDDQPKLPTLPDNPFAVQRVAEEAPEFTARFLEGGTFTLSDHLANDGRPLLLNFWASWCLPCRNEMPVLDAGARANPGFRFLGVATDDTEDNARSFADEIAVDYELAYDVNNVVGGKYGIIGLPTTLVIDPSGTIVGRALGELTPDELDELLATYDG